MEAMGISFHTGQRSVDRPVPSHDSAWNFIEGVVFSRSALGVILAGWTRRIRMVRNYSKSASKDVEREMHKFKRGKLKSGKGGKGGTVKSRKQAIAIGLSEARKKGKKVPKKKAS
ncbi:MAG TPA: DUF6496 domain-containing protein [Mesorhizobium sp.]|nr:DUF6496 domain-containing protein [Mesorhizobium sp.]